MFVEPSHTVHKGVGIRTDRVNWMVVSWVEQQPTEERNNVTCAEEQNDVFPMPLCKYQEFAVTIKDVLVIAAVKDE